MDTLHIKITGTDNLLATVQTTLYAVLNEGKEQPKTLQIETKTEKKEAMVWDRAIRDMQDDY